METKAELKKTDGNFEAKSDAGQPKQPAWRRRLNNFFYAVIYILVGCGVFWLVFKFSVGMDLVERCIALFATTSLGVMVAALLLTPLFNMISGVFRHFVNHIFKMPMLDICAVVLGLIIGLIIASLLNTVVGKISVIGPYISVVSLLFFAYLGMLVAHSKRSELAGLLNWRGGAAAKAVHGSGQLAEMKVVDTSAIIDGRMADVCRLGFLEGQLVVANFVLDELRHLADLPDVLKRNRGRRGLDILNRLQKELPGRVLIMEVDYPDIVEVDNKLLRLAQELKGAVLTNDFTLAKVAQVQGVRILNVNELANALKAVWLPGEIITIEVIHQGKEPNQGLAYLPDGTMIVVENGRPHIGRKIKAEVSSVLQTSTGRMIFVRPVNRI